MTPHKGQQPNRIEEAARTIFDLLPHNGAMGSARPAWDEPAAAPQRDEALRYAHAAAPFLSPTPSPQADVEAQVLNLLLDHHYHGHFLPEGRYRIATPNAADQPPSTQNNVKPLAWATVPKTEGGWRFVTDIEAQADTWRADGHTIVPLVEAPPPQVRKLGHTAADLVAKIAQVSNAVGFQAGEPAMEMAGLIVSILAANPEHIERFMTEGSELFLDCTFNHENGSLTYRAMNGSILSPSVLREKKGQQQ
ncbi:hypothetical protein [Rhizobium sp. NFR03]|uniref:hypothetical protein n=1 Tax=Rhizobium sp. NFR03 TaxID=1566263 RepID=UPI0008D8B552|nr:hypothetical protein [Rhizobium sp. NFR03]SER58435.1 hypothetical protein SAMN03159406_00574 [Rhizobium sp. NFR03]